MKSTACFLLCGAVYLNSHFATAGEKTEPEHHPKLVEILKQWEVVTKDVKFLDVTFEYYEYNNIFFVEKRGEGRFVWEAPNRGLITVKPAVIQEGELSSRTDRNGKKFVLKEIAPETWFWNGESISQIDDKNRSYKPIAIPKNIDDSKPTPTATNDWIFRLFFPPSTLIGTPQGLCPMVVDIQTKKLLEDYDWSQLRKKMLAEFIFPHGLNTNLCASIIARLT